MSRKRSQFVPYYEQVASVLRAHVLSMDSGVPVHLPTERDLCLIHHASRSSIRQALGVLETEGLIQRTPGRGTLTVPAGVRAWMRLRRSRMISVITSQTNQVEQPLGYYGRIYQGIARRCHETGFALSIRQMFGTFPIFGPEYRPEDPGQASGVIIIGVRDERVISMHAEAGYPVVCVDDWPKDPRVDAVVVDCFGEGQVAADYLLRQGHRSFFYVGNRHAHTGGNRHETDADLLLAGFERTLQTAGVPLPASRIRFCQIGMQDETDAMADWAANLKPRPTAGLVYSIPGALHFRACLTKRGVACPQDVSLIAKAHVGHSVEDMTVLIFDAVQLGCMAVDLLLERASEKRTSPVIQALRSNLQRGKSVRCLPM
jgi:DNA-binding LacI/PurR family transcriptional regulator